MGEPRKLNIGGAKKVGAPAEERVVYRAGQAAEQPAAPAPQAAPRAAPRQLYRPQEGQPSAQELYRQAQQQKAERIAAQRRAMQEQAERLRARTAATQQGATLDEPLSEEELRERRTLNGTPLVMPAQAAPRQLQDTTGALYDQEQLREAQQRYMQQRQRQLNSGYDPNRLARVRGSQPAPAPAPARTVNTAAGRAAASARTVRTPQAAPAAGQARRTVQQPQRVSTTQSVYSAAQALAAPGGRRAEPVQEPPQEELKTLRPQEPAGSRVQQMDLSEAQPTRAVYDMDADVEYRSKPRTVHRAQPAPAPAERPLAEVDEAVFAADQAGSAAGRGGRGGAKGAKGGKISRAGGSGGGGGKPPKGGKPGKGKKEPEDGGKKKPKKKGRWWKILLATLLALILIFGITFAVIWHAVAPAAGSISISQLLNTPKEYQGDYLNIVIAGVDWEADRADMYSDSANDGMTDMIMYMHFDFVENKVDMLQIPRNTLITSDASVSGNYQINAVARTQGSNGNNDIGRLCEVINEQWKLPVDGYISINMQSLKEIVDLFNGIEVYVPHDIEYNGSKLTQGYQTMDGAAAEFFVRNRKGEGYANSDLDRLNMQRYFYSGLFRRLKTMTAWDVAKLLPVIMSYMETSLNVSDIVSVGVSMLKIPSSNMMLCQMPVYMGCPDYNGNSIVAAARQEDADLLNQYFRGTTGDVAAEELGSCFDLVDTSGLTASDANVQFMGDLNNQAAEAQQTENLDGSATVTYVDPTPTPAPTSAAS